MTRSFVHVNSVHSVCLNGLPQFAKEQHQWNIYSIIYKYIIPSTFITSKPKSRSRLMTSNPAIQILDQGVGYGILVGVGAFFAIFIVIATWLSHRYLGEDENSTETFMVAGRSVGVGLTGSAVMSSWMWATVLIWSVQMVYSYGIAAGYLYAATQTVQIAILSVMAAESKKKIPDAHTSLEVIKLRYGSATHILFIFFSLVNNLLSCSAMVLGASSVFISLCDLHPVAANLLIPFGVMLYTAVGGLKSTFLTDYLHTFISLVIFMYFSTAGVLNKKVNGIGDLYDQVLAYQDTSGLYIEGNYKGSLLTMKSKGAWYFGLIHSIGDTGLSVMDSSFWQKAYSADVTATVPGYIIGSLAIYCSSFPLGTIWGLLNVIMEHTPEFPLPNGMSAENISNAQGLLFTLDAVLGKSAVAAALLTIFLSVTSTVSAQTISVSSIISFDIYRAYINKDAQNKKLIAISHFGVIFFGLFSAAFSIMLHYVGISVTWMSYFYSMVICPGVIPLLASIIWNRQTALAAFVRPVVGCLASLAVWLGTAKKLYGTVNIDTTMEQLPCLYGGLTALFLPGVLTVAISLLTPGYKFDWQVLRDPHLIIKDDDDSGKEKPSTGTEEQEPQDEETSKDIHEKDRIGYYKDKTEVVVNTALSDSESNEDTKIYRNGLTKAEYDKKANKLIKWAWAYAIVNILVTQILWPLPLYRDYVFSRTFFKSWVTFAIMTVYGAFLAVGIYPLWDGRHSLIKVTKGVYRDFIKRERGR